MYRVYRLLPPKLSAMELLYHDNVAGRQSITVREAKTLGVGGEGSLVLVEGSEEGVARADALMKETGTALSGAEAEAAYRAFRSQDEDAASGLGLVFDN